MCEIKYREGEREEDLRGEFRDRGCYIKRERRGATAHTMKMAEERRTGSRRERAGAREREAKQERDMKRENGKENGSEWWENRRKSEKNRREEEHGLKRDRAREEREKEERI